MIAGLLVAVLAVAHAAPADSEGPGPPEVGERLPAFGLFDLAGHRTRSTDIREPVIVLNFWAFWCDTWTAELPQLRELAAQQRALNFRLIAVSVDGAWADELREVDAEHPLPFPVLVDRGSRLSTRLRIRHIPTVIVVGRQRSITYVHEAYPGNTEALKAIRDAASTSNVEMAP